MKKVSFLSVLISNLKCFFCQNKNYCSVKYMPQMKKIAYLDGVRYVTWCERAKKAREDAFEKQKGVRLMRKNINPFSVKDFNKK